MEDAIYFLPFILLFIIFFFIERILFFPKNKRVFDKLDCNDQVINYGRVWMVERLENMKFVSSGEYVSLYSLGNSLVVTDDLSLDFNYEKKKYCITRIFLRDPKNNTNWSIDDFRRRYIINHYYFDDKGHLILSCTGTQLNYLSFLGLKITGSANYIIKFKTNLETQRKLENNKVLVD